MPTSIKLRLLMGGRYKTELATISVAIPGEHVYAMTSAAALTRELPFQADAAMGRRFQWVDQRERNRPPARKKDSERERMNQAAQLQEEAEEQQIIQDLNYLRDLRRTRGSIIVKSGWVGKGPKMPPTKIQNLFSKTVTKQQAKGGYEALPQEETEDVIEDINDPLNLELVRRLKESKNRELKKMLEKDALNPLADVDPLRHKLLRAQELYPQLHKLQIPLDDRDILRNQELMAFVRMIVEDQQDYRGLEEHESEPGGVDEAMKDAFARNKEAHERRREFEEKLLRRQKQIKMQGGNVYGLTPKAIVKEFEFGPQQTCFTSCMKAIFKERNRNLRPHREEIKPLSAANYQKCEISVHIIKGNSLPIREKFLGLQTQLDNMRAKAKRSGPIRGGRFDSRGPGGYPQQPGFQQQPQGFPGFQGQPQQQGLQRFGGAQGAPGFLGASDPYNRGMQPQQYGGPGAPGLGGPQANFGYGPGAGGLMDSRFQGNQGVDPGAGGYLGGSAASGMPLGTIFDIVSQMERVRTIVEVRLSQIGKKGVREERTVYTNNTEGPNPDWNEIVHIPYTLLTKQNFTMQQLLQEEATLYLNIFDVIKELKKQSYGQVLYTWEKRFLGMIEIPLMTVFQNKGKMDAILRVRRPLLMFDYQTTRQSLVAEGVPRPQQQQVVQGEAPSYMTVSIRLQPAIELPSENQFEHRSGIEDGQLIGRGVRWLKSWRKKSRYRDRVIKVFAENVEGKSIYLPRFLSPQKPPLDFYEENADDPYAIERVVRYVSLIPFADDNRAFQDMPDIFCTSQEFLDFGSGDYEEHSILLCNYFNYIDQGKRNIKSYVVFGMGYPEGYTAYVLRRNINTNSVQLWNAVTGEGYYFPSFERPRCCSCWALFGTRYTKPFDDPKCPLKEIGCIISEQNIYVNLQENADPSGMSFNLENKKFWKPFLTPKAMDNFFGRGVGGVRTVNKENLDYTDLQTHLRQQLEEEVELFIAQMFENERGTFRQDRRPLRTLWRNDLRDRLRAVLVQLEQFKFKMRNGATDSDMIHPQAREEEKKAALLSRLKDDVKEAIGPGREVFGFPLNKSYTKKERMWEEVRNTDMHNVPDEEAQFALACAVFNYPCTVYSVWIYICCIQKEKS